MIEFSFQPEAEHMNSAGHIDNVEVYRWFNQQRLELFRLVELPPGGRFYPALATTNLEFIAELLDHCPIQICSFVSRVGKKSFTVEQEMVQASNVCARSVAVSVKFDRDQKASVSLSQKERTLMKSLCNTTKPEFN